MITFDFRDGKGPVTAKQHINPDGSIGGWVAYTATVETSCFISINARVYDYAQVYGDARVYDYARVYGEARVYGDAQVYGDARVYDYAQVYGDTRVCGDARVYNYAQVYGDARVYDYARVYGEARVYDYAQVCGDARVYDYAQVFQNMKISFSKVVNNLTLKKNIRSNIKAQTGLIATKDYVICFKQVNKNLTSFHDNTFQYVVGKEAVAVNYEEGQASCAAGLHFSNATYWENNCASDSTYLVCKVMLKDIITIQEGKIRAKKCLVLDAIEGGF